MPVSSAGFLRVQAVRQAVTARQALSQRWKSLGLRLLLPGRDAHSDLEVGSWVMPLGALCGGRVASLDDAQDSAMEPCDLAFYG